MSTVPEPDWLRPDESWQPTTPDYCDWFAHIAHRSMAPGLKIIILLIGARSIKGLPTDPCTIAVLLGTDAAWVDDCLESAAEQGWLRKVAP